MKLVLQPKLLSANAQSQFIHNILVVDVYAVETNSDLPHTNTNIKGLDAAVNTTVEFH